MALYGEESYGPKRRFGDLDLLGGVIGGEYREGSLDGGYRYFYEEVGAMSRLDIVVGEKPVFTVAMAEGEGAAFVAGGRTSAKYDSSGKLEEAALVVTDQLLELQIMGELNLPDDVVEKLWEQNLAGIGWMAVFKNLTGSTPFLLFSRTDISLEYQYQLEFNSGIPYAIPGTNWFVLLKQRGDRVGFESSGVDGRRSTHWFNRFLNIEALPVLTNMRRVRLEELKEMAFPGYELESAKKKSGKKSDGGGN